MIHRHIIRFFIFSVLLACATTPIAIDNTTTKTTHENSKSIDHPPLHLVLGLDGVGYSTFKKLYDGGYFREFKHPSQMVASFPSLSDSNWARLLQAPLSPSYTKAYFDMSLKTANGQGQPVGSLITHLTSPPKYEEGFDFKAEGIMQHFAMMTWTETSALYWLDSLEKQFLQTKNKDTFFAFIMNTDIIAHVQGEKALMEYLAVVDRRIKKLRENIRVQYGYELDVTIVSDHGNFYVTPKAIGFEESLKNQGWALAETIHNKNDLGYVIPEIISFGVFYCLKNEERRLAQNLSEIKGIHVATYLFSANRVRVLANNGSDEAEIFVDPKQMNVSYTIIKGEDPLQQAQYFKNGPLSWKDYFHQSYESEYPYSAVRIWEGFYKNSLQPGSVLVSPHLGYVFANQTLKMLTMLKGLTSTHGSLHRSETWGVFASTRETYPPIRPEDFSAWISLREYKKNLEN